MYNMMDMFKRVAGGHISPSWEAPGNLGRLKILIGIYLTTQVHNGLVFTDADWGPITEHIQQQVEANRHIPHSSESKRVLRRIVTDTMFEFTKYIRFRKCDGYAFRDSHLNRIMQLILDNIGVVNTDDIFNPLRDITNAIYVGDSERAQSYVPALNEAVRNHPYPTEHRTILNHPGITGNEKLLAMEIAYIMYRKVLPFVEVNFLSPTPKTSMTPEERREYRASRRNMRQKVNDIYIPTILGIMDDIYGMEGTSERKTEIFFKRIAETFGQTMDTYALAMMGLEYVGVFLHAIVQLDTPDRELLELVHIVAKYFAHVLIREVMVTNTIRDESSGEETVRHTIHTRKDQVEYLRQYPNIVFGAPMMEEFEIHDPPEPDARPLPEMPAPPEGAEEEPASAGPVAGGAGGDEGAGLGGLVRGLFG